jgi:hypothetical protein
MINPLLGNKLAQIVLAVAGVFYFLTGIALLFAPTWFFQHIGNFPPYNRHYEGDLGSFLLPLGVGLLLAARAPGRYKALIWVAATGSLLHVGNHIYDALVGSSSLSAWLFQIVPLLVLAIALLVISWVSYSSER